MAEVHQLIIKHGIEEARRQAVSKHARMVIEAAYQVISDDAEKMGFTYSGFALTSLPHKPQSELVWKRDGHNLTMLVESGRGQRRKASRAALRVLCPLHTALPAKRGDPLGLAGNRAWPQHASVAGLDGPLHRWDDLQESKRAGAPDLRMLPHLFCGPRGRPIKSRGGFVKSEITMHNVVGEQASLWQDRVLLDEDFFRALREHPVPVSEAALRAIGPRSMVIDVYIWLAYKLHALRRDVEVGWPALYAQFGAGFGRLRRFRAHFIECLSLAVAAYPEARVDIGERSVILRPSRPAIAKV